MGCNSEHRVLVGDGKEQLCADGGRETQATSSKQEPWFPTGTSESQERSLAGVP